MNGVKDHDHILITKKKFWHFEKKIEELQLALDSPSPARKGLKSSVRCDAKPSRTEPYISNIHLYSTTPTHEYKYIR